MTRQISICLLLLAAVMLIGVEAFSRVSPQTGAVIDTRARAFDEASSFAPVRPSGMAPVGVASRPQIVDSRGALVGQSWRDIQCIVSGYNNVAVNPPVSGNKAGVHFGFTAQSYPGRPTRWSYSCFDPENGTFPLPGGSVVVQDDGLSSTEGGNYTKVLVDPNGGKAILTAEDYSDANDLATTRQQMAFDIAPFAGQFGDLYSGSIIPNSIALQGSWTAGDEPCRSVSAMTVTATDTIFYIATRGRAIPGTLGSVSLSVKLFRKVGKSAPGQDNSWQLVFLDSSSNASQGVATDPTSTRVAFVWTKYGNGDPTYGTGDDVWYADSETGESGTFARHNVTNITPTSDCIPWLPLHSLFDSQGSLHLIFFGASSNGTILGRLWHWSEYNPLIRTMVYDANRSPINCRCSQNTGNIGRLAMGECENRIYVFFSAFGDSVLGLENDCSAVGATSYGANADVFLTVSKNLSGISWDAPRNLSASYTPNCDSGECASDEYTGVTPYGMDDADYPGTEKWDYAYTYDPGNSYTGSKYLQVFYTTDRHAGIQQAGGGPYTLNDLRWIRLACAEPVIEARLATVVDTTGTPGIQFPEFTYLGVPKNYKVYLDNVGNNDMTITSVQAIADSAKGPGAGPTNWIAYSGVPATVPEAGRDSMTLTLNANNAITLGPTVLWGKLRFSYTTPARTYDLPISFVVADTVVLPDWDTISTACLDLTVGTNGNTGGNYTDSVNMDYVGHGGECDAGTNSRGDATIYLGEGSPVIIRKPIPTSYVGSWAGWNNGIWMADPNAFKPVTGAGYAPHGPISGSNYTGFNSGTFLTIDSLVKVERTWWAPTHVDSCNFIVQRTRVFPAAIGTPVTNLQIGEMIDWDIPSDSGTSSDVSGFDAPKRLVWLRGFNRTDTVTDCIDNSKRYGGMALLNWFMKDKACSDVLYGGHAIPNDPYIYNIAADSLSHMMHVPSYTNDAALIDDQSALLTFKDAYTLPANDTLTIFTALATVKTAASTSAGLVDLKTAVDKAKEFMKKTVGVCASCCQGVTGNVNTLGIVDLSDLSALVSYLTGGGYVLPCPAEANVNNLGIVDLSDLSALVSYLTGGGYVLPNCS